MCWFLVAVPCHCALSSWSSRETRCTASFQLLRTASGLLTNRMPIFGTSTGDKRTCPQTFGLAVLAGSFQRLGSLFPPSLRGLSPADRLREALVFEKIARRARFAPTGSSSGTTSEAQRSRQTSTFGTDRVCTSAASPARPTTTRPSRKRCTLVRDFFLAESFFFWCPSPLLRACGLAVSSPSMFVRFLSPALFSWPFYFRSATAARSGGACLCAMSPWGGRTTPPKGSYRDTFVPRRVSTRSSER